MRQRRIGDLEVSVVGLGGNNFGTTFFGRPCDQDDVTRIVRSAIDAGVTLFDTAEEYSISSPIGEGRSEEMLGIALGDRRDDVVIATKFLPVRADRPEERGGARIVAAVEESLTRLGTDRIDLYQQHQEDPETPVEEMLEALDRLRRAGKIREIGGCNMTPATLDEAASVAAKLDVAPFRTCQTQYNLLERPDADLLAAVERHSMQILPYFPLASGLLTGKYRRGEAPAADSRLGADGLISNMLRDGIMQAEPPLSDSRLRTVEALTEFAGDHGRTILELAISWLVAQPTVASVIAGATRAEQVVANAAAAGWELTSDDLAAVDAIVAARAG